MNKKLFFTIFFLLNFYFLVWGVVSSLGSVVLSPGSFTASSGTYDAFSEQTATDPVLYKNATTNTVIPAETANKTIFDYLGYLGKDSLTITTTARPAYLYNLKKEQSSTGAEWEFFRIYPAEQKAISFNVAAGYIVSDAKRFELSQNINLNKNLNLFLIKFDKFGCGFHEQHGFKGKFGYGPIINTEVSKLFGIEVTKIFETTFFFLKGK